VTSLAQEERARLADELVAVGPDAPTLCAGWDARDLAAHVMLRERRPDAAAGIRIAPLAGWTASVQEHVASSTPWPELVAKVRQRSPLLVGPMDDWINTAELYVHTEDVRRAQPGWTPLPFDARREGVLWRVLRRGGRLMFRHATMGVVLALPEPDGRRHTARDGTPAVTVTGRASELVLYAYGRRSVADVAVTGEPAVVREFGGTDLEA
jgi:uncharacterized protein (TIGR03085 family)